MSGFIEKIKENLENQHRSLLEWLSRAPDDKLTARLGPYTRQDLDGHVHVLESALKNTHDHTLGLCTVCHDFVEPARLEADYTSCVCIEHLSGVERKRLEEELELSAKVQKALLPEKVPETPGLRMAAFTQPAHIVGGDYFDFFTMKSGHFGFAIGDVMGKGISASLLMSNLQASLRILVRDQETLDEILNRLNCLFIHNIRLVKFVTLFLAEFDAQTKTLTYSNAGQNPPLLRRADGSMEWLKPTGPAVGLIEEALFKSNTIRLGAGDLLVMYTDGLTETKNGTDEEFGEDRLLNFSGADRSQEPSLIIRNLREHLKSFSGNRPLEDDTTILAALVK